MQLLRDGKRDRNAFEEATKNFISDTLVGKQQREDELASDGSLSGHRIHPDKILEK